MKELTPELIESFTTLVEKIEGGYIPPKETIDSAINLVSGAKDLVTNAKTQAKKLYKGKQLKEQTGKLKTVENLLKRLETATAKADKARKTLS